MEGGTKEKCNEENDNCSSLRITSQAKANIEPNDNQNNDIKNSNKEGNTKHDNEEGHSNDKFKAIEDDSRRNKVETTLTQLLKNNDKLLNAQDKLLEDKNKLLENQKKLLKSRDKLFETKDKLIESQEVVIEKQNQLLMEMEKLLEKNSTGADGIEEVVVRKITSRRQKAKDVDNAEDARSEQDRVPRGEDQTPRGQSKERAGQDYERRDSEGQAIEYASQRRSAYGWKYQEPRSKWSYGKILCQRHIHWEDSV